MTGEKGKRLFKYLSAVLMCLVLLCIGAFSETVSNYLKYKEEKAAFMDLSGRLTSLEKNYGKLNESYEELKTGYAQKRKSSEGLLALIKLAYDRQDWEGVAGLAAEMEVKFRNSDEYGRAMEYRRLAERNIRQEQEEKERKRFETGITYENLALEQDKYKGNNISFGGRVLQSMESGNTGWLRLAVDDDTKKVIFAEYNKSITDDRIYADEKIRIYGTADGFFTYKTTSGKEITIPKVNLEMIGRD